MAFRDIHPVAPVHVLVVPRRHIENAAAVSPEHADDVVALFTAARAVAEAEGIDSPERGYRLIFNVGPDALNSVPHLHLHVIGGRPMTGRSGERHHRRHRRPQPEGAPVRAETLVPTTT